MSSPMAGKKIVLGVSGGIAAYKAVELLRLLTKAGAEVYVVMTENAKQFITPLTFEALSGRPVYHKIFDSERSASMEHIRSAENADLMVVAPATANTIGKMANGLADDPLSTLYAAFPGTVIVAPAMNDQMWANQAVQDNLLKLKVRGVDVVEPDSGELACGVIGLGRLAEPQVIFDAVWKRLEQKQDWAGRRVLVTAGPTREPIDPVRFITNHSSGKMGYAIAEEAQKRGAVVTLISGPTSLGTPAGVEVVSCQRASEMRDLVMEHLESCDVLVMTAAVGDFAPADIQKEKIKKSGDQPLLLNLQPTPDILKEVAAKKTHQTVVGFAAESENVVQSALDKLQRKQLDLIVANDISAPGIGFQSDFNQVQLIRGSDNIETLPRLPKREIAGILLDRIRDLSK
ncbi:MULTISPECIES: bifunctional phosphopantothenoylcysteine decarboxylase/phosphopantothenate--cysteine ligase CoaBC [unclassified Nitrospina]|uniref:bifunctional phosphopantothenoylcysteine decarboxylase/phosphopantothenate--cysteine ligase CoaBC n=1 Tax=unclassified Nitrospina TaxID=2638683 RepID=UPI003F9C2448